ncbi:MAG: tetrathionate reductase family octaheme c-type cytochrome [Cytophagales bacterium]|nr:tetrathionate reductase family octaheme c-type cytochrome [Cytophagales bacterium]
MKNKVILVIGLNLILFILMHWIVSMDFSPTQEKSMLEALRGKYGEKYVSSVDHSKFEILQKEFATPQEVTRACISCHTERHKEVMKSNHWKWEREEYIEGRGVTYAGKNNLLNNFCIGSSGNEKACAKCHIGFDFEATPDFYMKAENVDCMVCHDNSSEYMKGGGMAGLPAAQVNLTKVAQSVSRPANANCGACHFFSGGGNNVKHGDLEAALLDCSKDVDVHMASEGTSMACVDCHTADKHIIKGKLFSLSSEDANRATCRECHGALPHEKDVLNTHTAKVACQTCHIPVYAKENATKMYWDWSTAGRLKEGKPFHLEDSMGNHSYMSAKGSFVWEKNVKPEYVWFNGTADHYILGDKVDTLGPIQVNRLNGSFADGKIIPVKVHRGRQPYDPVNQLLIQPFVYSKKKGEGAYWKDFDWVKASEVGMSEANLPFSGEVTFPETEMYWPLNHMVAPADQSLGCSDCHVRSGSRLAGLSGFYMPGRDGGGWLDEAGTWVLLFTVIGVSAHALSRIIMHFNSK